MGNRVSAQGRGVRWAVRYPWYFLSAIAVAGFTLLWGVLPTWMSRQGEGGWATEMLFKASGWVFLAVLLVCATQSAIQQGRRRNFLDSKKTVQSIRTLSWQAFERLLQVYYTEQGFEVELSGGGGADGGIDLVLRKGRAIAGIVQAKQYRKTTVRVGTVREMGGLMASMRAPRGIIVTSGSFTKGAIEFANDVGIEMIDGPALSKLIRDANGGKDLEYGRHCPKCGGEMATRLNRKSMTEFLGCKRYPKCDGTSALN